MNHTEKLAGKLYDAYCAQVGGRAFNGDPLPNWEAFLADPKKKIQSDAWVFLARMRVLNSAEEIGQARQSALELCWAIEALPASEQQTKCSVLASGLTAKLNDLLP